MNGRIEVTKTIQINYDLRQPGRNYDAVEAYIKAFPAWAHPLKSLWLVRTDKTASTVRNEMNTHVDANDQVLVFDVTGDSWASNFSDSTIEWMQTNMGIASARNPLLR
jgi:hypothetical protein